MLATSWKATGLVRAAWLRLDVEKDKRGELAARTGIPATNLSGMNTGRIPMTRESARRIATAVPGLTEADLGAPSAELGVSRDERSSAVVDLLVELQERIERAEAEIAALRAERDDPSPTREAPRRDVA